MGKSNTQIATRADVNAKRLGAFVTSTTAATYMKKCVTKKAVTDIQYLSATATTTTSTLSGIVNPGNRGNSSWATCWGVGVNNGAASPTSAGKPITSNMYAYVTGYSSSTYYHSSTTSTIHCIYTGGQYSQIASTIINSALCSKSITTTAGKYTTLMLTVSPYCNASTSSTLSTSYNVYPNEATNHWYIAIIDSNNTVLATSAVQTTYTQSLAVSLNFTPSTSSVTMYFVVVDINMRFYPVSTGNLYVYAGFNLAGHVQILSSNYNSVYKCVQYQDIAATGGTFSCAYYIYNNKSSNAKLDWVKCYVGATSDPTKGTWTEVGSTIQGTVDTTAAGSVLCTIPSSKISSTQQWFHVRCAYTSLNQQWYGGWGSGGANSNADTYCGKQTWGYTPAVPLTSPTGANAVLNYNLIRSAEAASMGYIVKGIYGQTTTRHALFRIE